MLPQIELPVTFEAFIDEFLNMVYASVNTSSLIIATRQVIVPELLLDMLAEQLILSPSSTSPIIMMNGRLI